MPVLVNKSTGLAEDLSNEEAAQATSQGTHQIPLYDPSGNQVNADYSEAPALIRQGYSQPRPEELNSLLEHADYNSDKAKAGAAALGAAEGFAGPLGTIGAKTLGFSDEQINKSKEYNPGIHAAGQIAGLTAGALTGTGEAALLAKAGAATEALGLGKIAASAAKGLVENGLFQAQDEVSKLITHDPKQSAETAMVNVGLSGLLGAGIGGGLGAVSQSWDALGGSKLGQVIEDFKGRVKQHIEHPDPAGTLTTELQDLHTNVTNMNSEVYGKTGLKAQDIEKLLPDMTPRIQEEPSRIESIVQDTLDKMRDRPFKYGGDRYAGLLDEALTDFKSATFDAKNPSEVFNAVNELKQKLGQYSKPVLPDNPAYDAVKEFQTVGKQLRTSLEDKSVWGQAGERQASINKAFAQFKTPLKDFESKFTTKLGDERVIDPGKVQTYINQLGKANAEIKQEALRNFVEAAEKYKATIADTHANLGIENPYGSTSTTVAKDTLQELTPGAKLADAMIKKGIGEILGTAIGAGAGAGVGHPYIGGLLGEKLLSPTINKIIPSLVKPMLTQETNGTALKGAVQYGVAVMRGESALTTAAKAVFDSSVKDFGAIDAAKRDKLKEQLDEVAVDQNKLLNIGGHIGYYLPDHAAHMGQSAASAIQYLAALKPQTAPLSPLDSERTPSKTEEAVYNRALDVAENPLLVLKAIRDGSLTQADIQNLQALAPNLYSRMQEKLMNELIQHKSDGKLIPYKTKIAMSMFMAQPLDSSMTPQAIVANQPILPMAPQGQPQHKQRSPNMSQTSKLPATYLTPQQSRTQFRGSRTH